MQDQAKLAASDLEYLRHVQHPFFNDQEAHVNEFTEHFQGKAFGRARRNIAKDVYSAWSCLKSLYEHLCYSEFIAVTLLSLGMTLFFCLYLYPATPVDYHLAARLRFNIIVTAVLFPSTMLATETLFRRESALRRLAAFKAGSCQTLQALLIWRAPNIKMSSEWDRQALLIMRRNAYLASAALLLPTLRDRHRITREGQNFAFRVTEHRDYINKLFMKNSFQLHCLVEDLKERGLTPMESIRLFNNLMMISRDMESMLCIKKYRTGSSARVFVRIVLTSCLMFYGPYYSYVAGSLLEPDNAGQMNVVYSCVLTVLSTILLLTIVAIHRATEDPFLWHFSGNAVEVESECEDLLSRLDQIYDEATGLRRRSTATE